MRPTNEKCQYCKFWDGGGEVGDCRRHAPVSVYDDGRLITAIWPVTMRSYWCGDYDRNMQLFPEGRP